MNFDSNKKKEANFELNLLPVFDILSACICFLLMTAVWIHVGTVDVSQAIGGQAVNSSKNPPSVWATMNKTGQLVMTLKDAPQAPSSMREIVLNSKNGMISWEAVSKYILGVQKRLPTVKTALIMPHEQAKYDDIIRLMDQFKTAGLNNIGISPL